MGYYAGLSALGEAAAGRDSGLMEVVDAPAGRRLGTAVHRTRNGRAVYEISLDDHSGAACGEWILVNGQFLRVGSHGE